MNLQLWNVGVEPTTTRSPLGNLTVSLFLTLTNWARVQNPIFSLHIIWSSLGNLTNWGRVRNPIFSLHITWSPLGKLTNWARVRNPNFSLLYYILHTYLLIHLIQLWNVGVQTITTWSPSGNLTNWALSLSLSLSLPHLLWGPPMSPKIHTCVSMVLLIMF